MREEARFKNFIIESLFVTSSFLHDNQFFSCKSEHIKIPTQSCSDKSNDTSDIPMDNSGLNRINQCNNSLIDEPIENFICSDLDMIVEPKESLSDNTIANNKFDCDTDIIENTDDSSGNRNNDSNGNNTLSNCFIPININETFTIGARSNTSRQQRKFGFKNERCRQKYFTIKRSHRSSTEAPT